MIYEFEASRVSGDGFTRDDTDRIKEILLSI